MLIGVVFLVIVRRVSVLSGSVEAGGAFLLAPMFRRLDSLFNSFSVFSHVRRLISLSHHGPLIAPPTLPRLSQPPVFHVPMHTDTYH